MKNFIKLIIAILFFSQFSYALSPEERLANQEQEQRAMQLFLEVKCLVCNGQSIESSNTEFSSEMRKLIRQKITEEKSDEEVRQELVAEFGDDILLSSQKSRTLWLLTIFFIILLTAIFIRSFFRRF